VRCIAIDVGNTSTALGLVSGHRVQHVHHIRGGIRKAEETARIVDQIVSRGRPERAVLGSVVPAVTPAWIKLLKQVTGKPPLVIHSGLDLGVKVDYPKPETIGPDRLANASGAVGKWGPPAIVADFGTALTFDIVDSRGAYIGGVIAPGLPLMTEYLAEKTALLPRVDLRGRNHRIGRSTVGAMRIGAHVGYRGIVREIVTHLVRENNLDGVTLCATGGYARWALSGIDLPFLFAPNLTLYGLGRILGLNSDKE